MRNFQIKYYFLLLLFWGCKNEKKEFLETDGGLKYKLHDIVVEGRSPSPGDFLNVYIGWKTNDSVYYQSTETTGKVNVIQLGQATPGGIEEGLFALKEGDSASFFVDPKNFYANYLTQPLPNSLKDCTELEVIIRLLKVQSSKEYFNNQKLKQEELEINEMKSIKKEVENWKMEYDSVFEYKGCYMVYLSSFQGDTIKKGDEITIQYSSKFLTGEEFYSTAYNGFPETYLVGSKGQTVDGLQIAFLHMSKGQRAKILVPSYMGFGEKGSAGGIVPSFTPLIYEIEVLDE